MADEKIINRDIIYICDEISNEKTNNQYFSENKKDHSLLKFALGETASIAGLLVSAFTPFEIAGMATHVIGSSILNSENNKSFDSKTNNNTHARDDAIQIIPINFAKEAFENDGFKIKGTSNFSIGMILAKHPFLKDTYVEIDCLEKEILHNKLSCLSLIAQYLGAKSISGHAVITEEQKRIHDVSGEVTYEVINGNIQGKTEEYQKYESKYSLDDTFTGDFTPESYEYAKEEAAKFGLNEELDIQNLIDQRNPEHTTSIVSRKLNIELTREYNKAIDAAFSLSVPGIKLSAGYKGILESRKTIYFKMEIKF